MYMHGLNYHRSKIKNFLKVFWKKYIKEIRDVTKDVIVIEIKNLKQV